MSHDVLMDRVALLFQEADTDGNGTLSRAEFQQVRRRKVRPQGYNKQHLSYAKHSAAFVRVLLALQCPEEMLCDSDNKNSSIHARTAVRFSV